MEDNLFISNFRHMVIKKIIINVLIITIIVFILDFSIGKTLRYFYFKETSGLHYRTTYSFDSTKAEVLIFGGSRANRHYVPQVFEDSLNMSFYNTGRDGNGIFYQISLLKSILKRYTPKVIVLDYVGGFEYDAESYDRMSSILPYYGSHEEIRKTIESKSPYEKVKLISQIYPFNSKILTIAIGNMEINKKREIDDKGYVPLFTTWNEKIDSQNIELINDIDSNKINAFRDFLILSKKSNIKVFVVFSPIYLKMKNTPGIEICYNLCSSEKIPFWNFSEDTLFQNNNKLFSDIQHMNNNGAIIFSKIICEKIKNSYQYSSIKK